MDIFHLLLNYVMPVIISVLCVILLLYGFADRKKNPMPPAVSDGTAAPQEPPRNKRFLVVGILFLVVAALDFGQGNFPYGISMLLLGLYLMFKANGVIR